MPAVVFQPVTPGQRDVLFEAVRRYYAEDGIGCEEATVRAALGELLQDPGLGEAFFLEDGGAEWVGYVVFTYGFDHEVGGRLATITDLFIEPTHRRKGYARAVLAGVAERCRAQGVKSLELQPERHNVAGQALYRRAGFQERDRLPMFLPLI